MRHLLAVSGAVLSAIAVAGCSGGESGAAPRARPTVESSGSDCAFKQVTAGARREGRCVARGVLVTVVDRRHRLHGKDYDARILGIRLAKTVGAARARGRFAVVRLHVKTTAPTPRPFDRHSDLVFLLVDGSYFGENRAAENAAADSFRSRRTALRLGAAVTGTVVFDLPDEHARHVFTTGSNLILVPVADESKRFPTGTQPLGSLGYIRLWK
jgi:hypothetical protein